MSTGLMNQLEAYFADVDAIQGPVSSDQVGELVDQVREIAPTPAVGPARQQIRVAAAAFGIVLVLVGGLVLLAPFGGSGDVPGSQPAPTLVTTSSTPALPSSLEIHSFVVDGAIDVEWVELSGEVPYGIDVYSAGEYVSRGEHGTVDGGGEYRSDDGATWTFETRSDDGPVPEWVSENGIWGYITDSMFTGILLSNSTGDWEPMPRPPQASQSGDWEWQTRMLAVSGDIMLIVGGPSHEDSSVWRIDATGNWDLVGPVDYGRTIRAVPAGGFVYYDEVDSTMHTSADGVQWTDGVTTDYRDWESGDEIFPGLVYSEKAGQIWTSADAITWTYEFTSPPGGEYGVHLNRTNRGIVATRLSLTPDNTGVDSWLLAEDRRTWSALTPFTIGVLGYGAVNHGAAGDQVWLSVTGGEEPTLTPRNKMWTAQLSS